MEIYHYIFLIAYITWTAGGSLILKTNKKPHAESIFIMALWGAVFSFVGLLFSFIWTNPFANITVINLFFLVLRALVGYFMLLFALKALKYLPVSIVEPLSLTKVFPLLFLAWLFFGDQASIAAIVLVCVMFVLGVLLAVVQKMVKPSTKVQNIDNTTNQHNINSNNISQSTIVSSDANNIKDTNIQVFEAPTTNTNKSSHTSMGSTCTGDSNIVDNITGDITGSTIAIHDKTGKSGDNATNDIRTSLGNVCSSDSKSFDHSIDNIADNMTEDMTGDITGDACDVHDKNSGDGKKYALGLLFLALNILVLLPQRLITRQLSSQHINPIVLQLCVCIVAVISSTCVLLINRQKLHKIVAKNINDKKLFFAAICKYSWMYFYYPLLRSMNQGVLESLLVTASVLILLGGRVLLKEKIHKLAYVIIVAILGCAVALAGA